VGLEPWIFGLQVGAGDQWTKRPTVMREKISNLDDVTPKNSVEKKLKHFPGCELSLPTETNWLEASGIICKDKIWWAIAGFEPCKTAVEDGIFPALWKNGIEVLINTLRKI
jgi:hypothetical protein